MPVQNIRVGAARPLDPRHKRLGFTAGEWSTLLGLSDVTVPLPLRPTGPATGAPMTGHGPDGGDPVASLQAIGVLTPGPAPQVVPEVEQSMRLIAGGQVALHVVVAGRALRREVWWALDGQRAVGVYRRADGGVDWVLCGARNVALHLPAVVPTVEELEPSTVSIAAALTGQATARGSVRERFSLPLSMLSRPDPLATPPSDLDEAARRQRAQAEALLASARGTLTARVMTHASSPGQTPRAGVGELRWLAASEGWWSVTKAPRPSTVAGAPVADGPWARVTPVEPGDLSASLTPLLTLAFELAGSGAPPGPATQAATEGQPAPGEVS